MAGEWEGGGDALLECRWCDENVGGARLKNPRNGTQERGNGEMLWTGSCGHVH